ncbi:MAG TPA: amidohydrolase family protein [Acidimicrobiia bacterium]|nr:amidohydrolase family protein [Acidimicrobiia bacterium]
MNERYLIISSDCHAGLPCEEYRPYLDPRYLDAFDDFLAERAANRSQALALNYDYIHDWESTNEEGLRGAFDSDQRDKELDADGVAGEVIFPDADAITGMESPPFGAGLSAGAIADPELAFAGARAHNRFLADLVAASPAHRAGVALVPVTHDVQRGVAEVEWAAEHGLRGVMIPTMWHDRPAYHERSYDDFWAACAANGLPVHTHSGEAPRDEYGDHIGIYLAEVYWWAVRPMWHLLFSGVFERFPDLKYVVTEAGAFWAQDLKWKWDVYMGGGHTTKKMAALMTGKLSTLPSEYFGTNLFIGASTMSAEEIRRRHVIGCDVAMWGTDYPHPEGTWPHTAERLRRDFASVPVDDCEQLFGATAARVYGFDVATLRGIADRIGPTPTDLGQDPARRSDPADVAAAQWWKAELA